MATQIALQDARCQVLWPAGANGSGGGQLTVSLFARPLSPRPDLLGSWEFGPLDPVLDGVEIDLWRLDLHSVRVRTPAGSRLARAYRTDPETSLSGGLALKATLRLPRGPAHAVLDVHLVVSPDELAALRRRLEGRRVPAIEWFFIELTSRCNYACAWCPKRIMTRPAGTMPLDRAKALLEQIADYRQRHPLFSLYAEIHNAIFLHVMGEPLLHRHLLDILDYGHRLGLTFCLVTNASLLCGDLAQRLLDSGLSAMTLSVNAPDESSFAPTRAPVSYHTLVQRVQHFIAERYRRGRSSPRIEIQLMNSGGVGVPQCSLVEAPAQVEGQLVFWSDFVRGLERETGHVAPGLDGDEAARWQTALERQATDPETYFALGHNVSLVFKRACNFGNTLRPEGTTVRETQRGRCPFRNPHRTLCVLWDGSCTFCSLDFDDEVRLGNVFEEGIDGIWAGQRLTRIRSLMEHDILAEPLCRRCLGTVVPASAW